LKTETLLTRQRLAPQLFFSERRAPSVLLPLGPKGGVNPFALITGTESFQTLFPLVCGISVAWVTLAWSAVTRPGALFFWVKIESNGYPAWFLKEKCLSLPCIHKKNHIEG
jgi:hypothetical protein